jgi:branched-chain amino acid transport system substrate-binding protein
MKPIPTEGPDKETHIWNASSGNGLAGRARFCRGLKTGILFGLTGPIESLTPPMADGAELAMKEATAAGKNADSSFVRESCDAAALIRLAMQKARDPAKACEHVMEVANAPGEKISPGELAKALQILKDGGDVDYVGGSDVERVGTGESAGTYRELENKAGQFETVRMLGAE